MNTSILEGKSILAVDNHPRVLEIMENEIKDSYLRCRLDMTTTYEGARELLASWSYDIAIVGMPGPHGCKLVRQAVLSRVPIVVVSTNGHDPQMLSKCKEEGATAHLRKENVHRVLPFLVDLVHHEYMPMWKRACRVLGSFFSRKFQARRQGAGQKVLKPANTKRQVDRAVILQQAAKRIPHYRQRSLKKARALIPPRPNVFSVSTERFAGGRSVVNT